MTEPIKVCFNYHEQNAVDVLRKAMRNPQKATKIVEALLKDQSKMLAYTTLKQLGKEINDLLIVAQAFKNTTQHLMKELHDDAPESQPS